MKLSVATDSYIESYSHGKVNNYGYFKFNHAKLRPYRGGLFCEEIFGPLQNYTCACGITNMVSKNSPDYKCPTCGVERTVKTVRRDRFGHIDVGVYYLNPLIKAGVASILGISPKVLEAISLGQASITMIKSSTGPLLDKKGNTWEIVPVSIRETGVTSINGLLNLMKDIGIDSEGTLLYSETNMGKVYHEKGLGLFDFFNRLVPVCPPEMRPMHVLGDRVGYDPRNMVYLRLIRQGIRIESITSDDSGDIDQETKEFIFDQESSVIQKLVNMLYVEGATNGAVEVVPIMNILGGKEGLFRNALLGKRTDFSGRSVITTGPELPIDMIDIPIKMAYELLKPFILQKLVGMFCSDASLLKQRAVKMAMMEYELKSKLAMSVMDSIIPEHRIILNRAPSLHRYSVMGFRFKVHDGKSLRIPPQICSYFNADHDGDTMAVHLALGHQSRREMDTFMSPVNNLLSSKEWDDPGIGFSHEQVVGSFMLGSM